MRGGGGGARRLYYNISDRSCHKPQGTTGPSTYNLFISNKISYACQVEEKRRVPAVLEIVTNNRRLHTVSVSVCIHITVQKR